LLTPVQHYRDDSTANVLGAPSSSARYSTQAALKRKTRRKKLIIIGFVVVAIIAATAAVVLALTLGKKHSSSSSSGSGSSSSGGGSGGGSSSSSTSGKSGSRITMEDGTTFTYTNNFGGDWAYDPKNPFAAGGLSQSWSKRVGSQDWVWGSDYVRGVNLGYVNFNPGIFMMALSFFAEDG
jgi:glucan 1,3-beta-glucosidase